NEVAWSLGSNDPNAPAVSAPEGTYLCPATVTILGSMNGVDTYIDKNQPTTPHGTGQLLTNPGRNNTQNSTKYTLIRFELTAVPAAAIIQSATLGLNVTTNKSNHF